MPHHGPAQSCAQGSPDVRPRFRAAAVLRTVRPRAGPRLGWPGGSGDQTAKWQGPARPRILDPASRPHRHAHAFPVRVSAGQKPVPVNFDDLHDRREGLDHLFHRAGIIANMLLAFTGLPTGSSAVALPFGDSGPDPLFMTNQHHAGGIQPDPDPPQRARSPHGFNQRGFIFFSASSPTDSLSSSAFSSWRPRPPDYRFHSCILTLIHVLLP